MTDEMLVAVVEEKLRPEGKPWIAVEEPAAEVSPAVTPESEAETATPPATLILDLIERIRNL